MACFVLGTWNMLDIDESTPSSNIFQNSSFQDSLKWIIEAALFAAGEPVSIERLQQLFEESQRPTPTQIRQILAELALEWQSRSLELAEVASGFRIQVRPLFAPWVSRLWEERATHYSRALLETLALIAYRQPITRAEIEAVRGVSISSSIFKTLTEREWIKVLGHREVPGRPALYGTTRAFLDYFNLKSLSDLPPLADVADLDQLGAVLVERPANAAEPSQSQQEPSSE